MNPLTSNVISILATVVLLGQIFLAFLIIVLVLNRLKVKNQQIRTISKVISNNYVALIFVVSAAATAGSLMLSEVLAFVPCKLCWFQRIFMYPITIISFIGLLKNDSGVKRFVTPLAIIGLVVAIYHILVQIFPLALECTDDVAKCSAVEFAQFGYITIPVMSLTAFLLLIVLSLFKNKGE